LITVKIKKKMYHHILQVSVTKPTWFFVYFTFLNKIWSQCYSVKCEKVLLISHEISLWAGTQRITYDRRGKKIREQNFVNFEVLLITETWWGEECKITITLHQKLLTVIRAMNVISNVVDHNSEDTWFMFMIV